MSFVKNLKNTFKQNNEKYSSSQISRNLSYVKSNTSRNNYAGRSPFNDIQNKENYNFQNYNFEYSRNLNSKSKNLSTQKQSKFTSNNKKYFNNFTINNKYLAY